MNTEDPTRGEQRIAELEASLAKEQASRSSFLCQMCNGTGQVPLEGMGDSDCPVCDGDPVITYEVFASYSRQIDRYRGVATVAERKQREAAQRDAAKLGYHQTQARRLAGKLAKAREALLVMKTRADSVPDSGNRTEYWQGQQDKSELFSVLLGEALAEIEGAGK